jgi:hypothetical protein
MVLSQTAMEMLEQEFAANCLIFIYRLENKPTILLKKQRNTALRQFFSRTGSCKKAVTFTESTAAILSISKSDAPPSKRITEIHSSMKLLKGLQHDIKFQWIPSHCGVVGNEMADYLAMKGKAINQICLLVNYHFTLPN